MQIEIALASQEESLLSFDYLYGLHSALMHCLTVAKSDLADTLHNGSHRNRIKLFSFSPLSSMPQPRLVQVENDKRKRMLLGKRVWFRIASPWPELLNNLGEGLLRTGTLSICGKSFKVTGVAMTAPPEFSEHMTWRPFGQAASICCSWTQSGSEQKTYVYPDTVENNTPACERLLIDNLRHKWLRLREIRPDITESWLKDAEMKTLPEANNIKIEFLPLDERRADRTMQHYAKNSLIRSWRCPVCVSAPIPLQRLIWGSGLGEMGSQGYGLMQEGKSCC